MSAEYPQVLPWIVELYFCAGIDLVALTFLLLRRSSIKRAGHKFNTIFPYSVKVKMMFMVIWILVTLVQVVLSLMSGKENCFWLL